MKKISLNVMPLTQQAFAAFGDVIETDGRSHYSINNGTTERYHDLAKVDLPVQYGRLLINIFRAQPNPLPIPVKMLERHPLSSQTFIPLSDTPFLIVVAAAETDPRATDLYAFLSNGRQGVNYHRAVWHHPLLALEKTSDFVVVDLDSDAENCDEFFFDDNLQVTISALIPDDDT